MEPLHDLIARARRSAEAGRATGESTRQLLATSRGIQQWSARVQGRFLGETGSYLTFSQRSNRLLGLLPVAEFERLLAQTQGVRFKSKQVIYRARESIDYVYFPLSGVLSAQTVLQDGSMIEVATIGNEGMVGLNAFVGGSEAPCDVVVQGAGEGLRLSVAALDAELRLNGLLRHILIGYHSVFTRQQSYQIACNGLHTLAKRCCRHLLCIQDRIGADLLPLTHDTLARSLGVRRATVSDELGLLREQNVIQNCRGRIHIIDRPRLQSLACECYEASNDDLARLFRSTGLADMTWPPTQSERQLTLGA